MGRRHVDRPTPRVDDRDVGEAGEEEAKTFRRLHHRTDVVCEGIADRRPGTAATAAKRNPVIPRGSEVAHRRAQVANQLSASPMDRLEALRRRRREDDVAAPCDQSAPELRPSRRPGVDRDHRVRRAHQALGRDGDRRRTGHQAGGGRAFVNRHPTFEQDAAQAPDQARRLHGGAVAHERTAAERSRIAPGPDFCRGELSQLVRGADLARQPNHALAYRQVLRRGRRIHVAGLLEPRVDAMSCTELTYGVDAGRDRPARAHGGFRSVERHQVVELVPPPAREPAVAPARAAAANVLLEDHDPEVGIGFGQEVRGPQAREAATDDDDIGVGVRGELGAIRSRLRGQRLPQPPASLCSGRQRVAAEVEPGDRRRSWHRHKCRNTGPVRD